MNAWRLVPGACLPALLLCGLTALSEPAQAEPAPTYSSPGCTAVNGGVFNLVATPAQQYRSHVQSGFVPGDQLTFSISVTDTGADQWWITNEKNTLLADTSNTSGTRVYTVTGTDDTTLTEVVRVQSNAPVTRNITVTASCSPGPAPAPTTDDSAALTNVQTTGSRMAASTSGAAITEAASAGTSAAFGGATPVSVGPNGITLNFAANPNHRTSGAFKALGFADDGTRLPEEQQRFNIWANIRGSWLTNSIDGSHVNATIGLGYKVTPDLVLGAFAGAETFDYDFDTLAGKLKGTGGTVGAYAGWRMLPALRLDGMVGWSGLNYDATAGAATGSFDASRWIVSGGLTGNHQFGDILLAPAAKLYVLWENQDAYTDSLGTAHASLDSYVGRASLGGRVSKAFNAGDGLMLTPYLELYGDWRFSDDNAAVGTPDTGAEDGLSGRTGAGFSLSSPRGLAVTLGGEVGGLGQDTQIWSASGRLSMPF
ncbi:autotransporter domain-containing protein [Stappia sp.]|uniref:autotransporter domain-containing protein n=1 Tax=Stappia sp. TaxID=1870903 RepID=UPI0025ECE0C8|nr:autotransporter domain-containing protein [Stappia sp.]